MADYDVQPLSLTAPPQPAYVTAYRPAVLVRNNGIFAAYASGTLRIYSAGRLMFTTSLLSGSIAPKGTKDALALDYWTPPAAGTYMAIATVTTDRDQVPSNDNLAPVTFTVSGGAPPPPPAVTAHAAQHEEGAADEIDLDGMRGLLAERQTPTDHHDTHQAEGDDPIDVTGLRGQLADPQPIATHGNAAHTTPYADAAAVAAAVKAHDDATTVHAAATSLELTARKGAANGYAGLDETQKVPAVNLGGQSTQAGEFLASDRTWKVPVAGAPAAHKLSHEDGGADQISISGLHGVGADLQNAKAHAAEHESGGADEISLGGLHGVAADAQTPEAHAGTHQSGSSDELSIAGLHGTAADAQTPAAHKASHQVGGADEVTALTLKRTVDESGAKQVLYGEDVVLFEETIQDAVGPCRLLLDFDYDITGLTFPPADVPGHIHLTLTINGNNVTSGPRSFWFPSLNLTNTIPCHFSANIILMAQETLTDIVATVHSGGPAGLLINCYSFRVLRQTGTTP
jgi:hypothetical protein